MKKINHRGHRDFYFINTQPTTLMKTQRALSPHSSTPKLTTEDTENLIVFKKKKTLRTQRKKGIFRRLNDWYRYS